MRRARERLPSATAYSGVPDAYSTDRRPRFEPTDRERDHDVGRFVRALWAEKRGAAKGTLEYAVAKELLNSALGKFGQRTRASNLLALERRARREGYDGVGGFPPRSPTCEALRGAPSLGSLWAPEWLALITGRARALMSEIVRSSNALLVSTDAVVADADAPLHCPAVDALRSVGSDLIVERRADAALIIRSRMYGLLRRAELVGPDEKVLARDDRWAVIKAARQGTPEGERDFAPWRPSGSSLRSSLRCTSRLSRRSSRRRTHARGCRARRAG